METSPGKIPIRFTKPITYVKSTVYHIRKFDDEEHKNDAYFSNRRGTVYIRPWRDLCFSRIEVRGVIISCTIVGSVGFQLIIDDGSGRLANVVWLSDIPSFLPNKYYNKYCAVQGQLIGFRTDIQLRVDSIQIVSEREEHVEEALWWIEVQEMWEALAASCAVGSNQSTSRCACVCHLREVSGTNIKSANNDADCVNNQRGISMCRTIGDLPSWGSSFIKAVHVIMSAIRSLCALQPSGCLESVSVDSIAQLVKDNVQYSEAVNEVPCYYNCATAEAVRQLVRLRFAVSVPATNDKLSGNTSGPQYKIFASQIPDRRIADVVEMHAVESRYPETPEETQGSVELGAARTITGVPRFVAACTPIN